MMLSTEQILEMMKGGKSADDIAKEFTTILNGAVQEQKKQEEAAKLAEKQKQLLKERKLADTRLLIKQVNEYLHLHYPKVVEDVDLTEVFDVEKLIEVMDNAAIAVTTGPVPSFAFMSEMPKKPVFKPEKTVEKDPIADFLNKYNLF